ncbi:hypothetical protein DEU56DRAFT_901885 [Suillus clintonianus]|uniref:uncharacterized protein n=1 Tax=Suillus clintonianus TaxID=1904413 RepID=UPI001B86977E|nr:uncharacterized protein DEU56DRAFT_901885 [Suillus clintonianus]KAG2135140.1 hypothetical protein DEU56DRAFT_901885 [Suillus clintonianus]
MPKIATGSGRYDDNMDVVGVDEEREVDELLEDRADPVIGDTELMGKLREAWQMIWPLDVIVEWLEKQPACSSCVSQSRKCYPSPQPGSLRCMPCARSRAKPCPRKRQFQVEKSAEVLQLTVEHVERLVEQADASPFKMPISGKLWRSTSEKNMRRMARKSTPGRVRAKNDFQEPGPSQIISAPAPNFELLSPAYPDTDQNPSRPPQNAPTGLTIKLPPFVGRGANDKRTNLVEPDPRPEAPIHHSPVIPQDSHVTIQDVLPNEQDSSLLWSPLSSVGECLPSLDVNNPPVEEVQPQPPAPPPVVPDVNPAHTVITLNAVDSGFEEEFEEVPVVFASELDRAEEEIARLKSALEAQEKEVARLQRNLKRRDEQLEDIREELDEVIHLPTPRATAAAEHENSMRKYTACQYVARTLRAMRVEGLTEEEREALLLKAERHLGRLANVEMDGIWDPKADADALFLGLVNGSSARAARHAQRGATNPTPAKTTNPTPAKTSVSASGIPQQRPPKRRRQGDSEQL